MRWFRGCIEATVGKKISFTQFDIQEKKIKINTYSEWVIKSKSLTRFPINLSFQEVSKFFVSTFEHDYDKDVHTRYNLSRVKIKSCIVRIDGNKSFNRFVKNYESD